MVRIDPRGAGLVTGRAVFSGGARAFTGRAVFPAPAVFTAPAVIVRRCCLSRLGRRSFAGPSSSGRAVFPVWRVARLYRPGPSFAVVTG